MAPVMQCSRVGNSNVYEVNVLSGSAELVDVLKLRAENINGTCALLCDQVVDKLRFICLLTIQHSSDKKLDEQSYVDFRKAYK